MAGISEREKIAQDRDCVAIITDRDKTFEDLRPRLSGSFRIQRAGNESQIKDLFSDPDLRAIIVDLDSIGEGGSDAVEVLAEMRSIREDLALVAMTRSADPTISLRASEAGTDEFVLASADFGQLGQAVGRAIEKRTLQFQGQQLRDQVESKSAFCGLIGGSVAMQKVYQAIQAVADSNASLVLRGESGTGKELVAQAILQSGERRDKPFVCLNCSALPETLIESELFGYEKGAFTGADTARPGLIETAHTGTLFMDEITTLDHSLQSKLLRVLQEHSVQRLGGRSSRKIDFRLITATNEDLEDLVKKGRFREDLYYRIHVVPIFIPPLRERHGDVALLVQHFLGIYCSANKKAPRRIQPDAMQILEDYSWPGNVRELENVIQRLVVINDGPEITVQHLPQQLLYSSAASQEAILIPEEGVDFDAEMERIQVAYLNAALRRTRGRKSAAAALLRIDPQRMKYLCRKLKLDGGSGSQNFPEG